MRTSKLTVVFLLFTTFCFADVITFRHTGTGSGTLGGTPFTNAAFVITDVGNTGDRQAFTHGWSIDDTAASISIAGLGTFHFVTPTRTFVNNASQAVGFSRGGPDGADLFNGPWVPEFATYDLLSSIGPITGSAGLLQWSLTPVMTDGGVLAFNSNWGPSEFQATVSGVPEPGAIVLLATVLLGLSGIVRRGK